MNHIFLEGLEATTEQLQLSSEEASHVAALRINVGEEVLAFNGKGLVARVTLSKQASLVVASVVDSQFHEKGAPFVLALAGLHNKHRFEFAVEKATELGVTAIVPLHTSHVQRSKHKPERISAKCVAALTQSGRYWLPTVEPTMEISQLLEYLPREAEIVVGDQNGEPPDLVPISKAMAVVVGPEGGFSAEELNVLRADVRTRSMAIGHFRLRAETAAIAMMSVVSAKRH